MTMKRRSFLKGVIFWLCGLSAMLAVSQASKAQLAPPPPPPPMTIPGAPSMSVPGGPPAGVGVIPSAPIRLNENDRQYMTSLAQRIDKLIAEVKRAHQQMLAKFSGAQSEAAIAQAFVQQRTGQTGLSVLGDPYVSELLGVYSFQPFEPYALVGKTAIAGANYAEGARSNHARLLTAIAEFYDRYVNILNSAKSNLAGRPGVIARQLQVTPGSLSQGIRDALEKDVRYLESGHAQWQSAEKEFIDTLYPAYQRRLFAIEAKLAAENQSAGAILQDWEVQVRARHAEYTNTQDPVVRSRLLDALSATSTQRSPAYLEHAQCALSLGIFVLEWARRPSVALATTVYVDPMLVGSHLGGNSYYPPTQGDGFIAGMRTHLRESDPCGAPGQIVEARPQLRIAQWRPKDVKPKPALLDKDELSTPIPKGDYVAVNEIFYGHPFFVEAVFEERQPGEAFTVSVGNGLSVEVRRTKDNPLLYRSNAVVLTHEPGAREVVQ